jgi:hypothetical protein
MDDFMVGHEITPQIQKVQNLINENHKWGIIRSQKKKLMKSTKWEKEAMKDLIIFNELVFNGSSTEAKIIWTEIHENMAHQLIGVIKNPKVWILQNRFWLNSESVIKSLGLKIKQETDTLNKGKN